MVGLGGWLAPGCPGPRNISSVLAGSNDFRKGYAFGVVGAGVKGGGLTGISLFFGGSVERGVPHRHATRTRTTPPNRYPPTEAQRKCMSTFDASLRERLGFGVSVNGHRRPSGTKPQPQAQSCHSHRAHQAHYVFSRWAIKAMRRSDTKR